MRIMGKSPVDSGKYIVEITEKELQMFKRNDKISGQKSEQRQIDNMDFLNDLRDSEMECISNEELEAEDAMEAMNQAFNEVKMKETKNTITVDNILDSYNDKKITKQEMVSEINKIQGR